MGVVDWVDLSPDRTKCRAIVEATVNFLITKKKMRGISRTTEELSFSRTGLHGFR